MVRGKALSNDLRKVIVNLFKSGNSCGKIAKQLQLSRYTVRNIVKLYKTTGAIEEKLNLGRTSKISPINMRALRRIVKENRRASCGELSLEWSRATDKHFSRSTCLRAIKRLSYTFYKAKEKPLLTVRQKKNRRIWAENHQNWSQIQWDSVIWSDESRFEVCVGDCRSRVLRTKNETYHPDCLRRKVKFPASVMVWGCMSAQGVGKLHLIEGTVNAARYINILRDSLMPSIETLQTRENGYIFQQDGAACHTAKIVKEWMLQNNIPILDWVSSSPDLSPIETLWHNMKKKLCARPARTVPELKERLTQIWNSFTAEDCKNLVDTMPKRIQAVLKQKGDVTQW